jgi:small multidrug resistance pump
MLFAWIYLALAIGLEVAGTLSLKAAGDGNPLAVVLVLLGYVGSFGFLLLVLRRMDVSVAYAVWAGAGTALIAMIGITVLGEPASVAKLGSVALIVAGVVGLNLAGAH